VLLAAAGPAAADTPAFDRPGIAFSPSVLPPGGFSVELGVPEFVHSTDGTDTTVYTFDTNLRAGLAHNIELQLATPLYNYQQMREGDFSSHVTGIGDSALSVKVALPSAMPRFSWAALAGVTFPTGAAPFTNGHAQYRLATASGYQFDDTWTAGFYVNLNYASSRLAYRLSPNLDFALGGHLSGYLEAAYDHAPDTPDASIAGGGLAWMVASAIQLDASTDFGVSRHAPRVQGGLGISFYFN
jgi:hypothetical protein